FTDTKCGPNPLSDAGAWVASSHDGTKIVFSSCVYDETQQTFSGFGFSFLNQQAIAADGNVSSGISTFRHYALSDVNGNISSRIAPTDVYYGSVLGGASPAEPRQETKLNDSGSLFYQPWPHFFDIVDAHHGTLTLRFSLAQTISNVGVPMAIDSGGRHIYLITDRGLTIVDLGSALLSVGSLNPASALSGTQITVRGSGFDSLTSATLGGKVATVSFVDENTLQLIVPPLSSGPADLVLKSSTGASYRLESALIIP
ncbi:MAG TPA: IPT/TIG domain-containing protein, partial [Candidatus Angelobacter sp.]|nr:IPT/TIG domain-containing protein [Candidatus Angelobacter sp.]